MAECPNSVEISLAKSGRSGRKDDLDQEEKNGAVDWALSPVVWESNQRCERSTSRRSSGQDELDLTPPEVK